MAGRLLHRASAMSPQAETLAAVLVLARNPLARQVARRALLGPGLGGRRGVMLSPGSGGRWAAVPRPGLDGRQPGMPRRGFGGRRAAMPGRPAVRGPVQGALLVLAAAGVAALAIREYPAVRREARMWLM